MSSLQIETRAIGALNTNPHNPRTHSARQIRQIADSIRAFGFTNPVLIDDADTILVGHGRVAAAKLLGMDSLPTIRLSQMTEAQKRAYVIADNKLALNAGWDAAARA
jgi:ParB-like chromosome segregation protein Spo0J